jgi:hypothetical protein
MSCFDLNAIYIFYCHLLFTFCSAKTNGSNKCDIPDCIKALKGRQPLAQGSAPQISTAKSALKILAFHPQNPTNPKFTYAYFKNPYLTL